MRRSENLMAYNGERCRVAAGAAMRVVFDPLCRKAISKRH
jgi:hypothetical protein